MASYAYTFTSGDTVTPTKLNNARTVSEIVNADIKSDAAIGLSKLATGALPTAITVATANILDGNVTLAKLVTAVQQSLVPAGAVQAFAMNSAPAGWLAADGTAVSRSTYAALFAAIGTTYGVGDGSTTFALPDLRGIFVRGSGSQTISGITYNKTFAAKEQDALQGHYHTLGKDGNPTYFSGEGQLTTVNDFGALYADAGTSKAMTMISDGTNGTPRTASETRPANIAMLYCIKF
jgi:microcystin-dependent protein